MGSAGAGTSDRERLAEAMARRDAAAARALGGGDGEAAAVLIEELDRLRGDLWRMQMESQALVASESRTALALQGGNLSLWSLSCVDRRMSVDHAWLAMLGATLDPTVDEKSAWEAAVDPSDLVKLQELLDQHLAGVGENVECTFRLRRDSGGFLWLMARGQIVERDGDGNPVLLSGTMIDVTRWKTLEDQLRQSQKLESIGQLAAGIAHEINTPIQFIGDNARFAAGSLAQLFALLDTCMAMVAPEGRARVVAAAEEADLDYVRAELPKAMEQTVEGVERVASIVHAMKEFSHPGGGEKVATDINRAIESTVTISRNEWKFVAECELSLASELPLVPLLPGDFNQVILNLIVNSAHAIADAQRAGRPGPGRIRIATRPGDGVVEIEVSDDGCGIPESIRDRIYDPFFTTKEVGRGSGQGLAIARSVVVDKHGGTLGCTSQVGSGTVFIIRLPLEARSG
ncbi:MAG: PAS domain-containing protein [Planctomycetes bacterium]|nr:PAS domain-containing protein [Planctomycetota bacterium]